MFSAGCTITGVQTGTTGDNIATGIAGDEKTAEFSNIGDAIKALKQGKIACVLVDSETAENYVTKGSGLKIINDASFEPEEYALAVQKGNNVLLDKLNRAIAELQSDGTIDGIKRYYLGLDGGEQYKKAENIVRNGQLKVATSAKFPPYEFKNGEEYTGIDIDIMQAIADKLGYTLIINDMTFEQIIESVKSGENDVGASALSVTEKRLNDVDFTIPYSTTVQVMIVKEN